MEWNGIYCMGNNIGGSKGVRIKRYEKKEKKEER